MCGGKVSIFGPSLTMLARLCEARLFLPGVYEGFLRGELWDESGGRFFWGR